MSEPGFDREVTVPAEPYMNPRQLAYFHQKLLQMRELLHGDIRRTLGALRTETNISPGDEVDRAQQESQCRLHLLTEARSQRLLAAIDNALERIGQGSFGYCALTGEEIGLARLKANPLATCTVDAQERIERLGRLSRAGAWAV